MATINCTALKCQRRALSKLVRQTVCSVCWRLRAETLDRGEKYSYSLKLSMSGNRELPLRRLERFASRLEHRGSCAGRGEVLTGGKSQCCCCEKFCLTGCTNERQNLQATPSGCCRCCCCCCCCCCCPCPPVALVARGPTQCATATAKATATAMCNSNMGATGSHKYRNEPFENVTYNADKLIKSYQPAGSKVRQSPKGPSCSSSSSNNSSSSSNSIA